MDPNIARRAAQLLSHHHEIERTDEDRKKIRRVAAAAGKPMCCKGVGKINAALMAKQNPVFGGASSLA
jgi:hypothetical protein